MTFIIIGMHIAHAADTGVQLAISSWWVFTVMAALNCQLSLYAEGKAKARYLEKIQLLNGMDPFLLVKRNEVPTEEDQLPPVEAADLASYLVLETSFASTKQFKAHKLSMEAYNQFVSGWVKDVSARTIHGKSIVTGRVSSLALDTALAIFFFIMYTCNDTPLSC